MHLRVFLRLAFLLLQRRVNKFKISIGCEMKTEELKKLKENWLENPIRCFLFTPLGSGDSALVDFSSLAICLECFDRDEYCIYENNFCFAQSSCQ